MIEQSNVFGTENVRKRGNINTILHHIRSEWEAEKKLPFFQCAVIIPTLAQNFLSTLLPAQVVRGLEEGWTGVRLILWISMIAGVLWLCHVAVEALGKYINITSDFVRCYYEEKCFRKMMYLDYDVMEREQSLSGSVWKVLRKGEDFEKAARLFPEIVLSLLGIIVFGIVILGKNIVLLIPILISMFLRIRITAFVRRKHKEKHAFLSGYVKETAYITRKSKEFTAGKDIRIYHMADLFLKKYDEALKGMDRIFHTIHLWYGLSGVIGSLVNFLTESICYLFLIYQLVCGEISVSAFVFLLGLLSNFQRYFVCLLSGYFLELNSFFASLNYIRDFLEIPNGWPEREKLGAEKLAELTRDGVKLELRNVSYTYEGNETPVLSLINLTIQPGEKLALIGLNGAGKTTMVKLICGLYEPGEGEIFLNGVPVRDFNREEYYGLMAVMFQDATMLPFSLDENLTGQPSEEIHREFLEKVVELSGFANKYHSLEQKGESWLIKEVNERAVDFSGGEKQKLLFARALYKEAPFLILDEPTAALDPIAENELYQNFSEAVNGRTSLYISHRLSSTRFCDRIVLLEHGKIVEEGSHDSLMGRGGRYAELYEIQSRYYREDVRRRKREEDMGDLHINLEEDRRQAFDESK